MTDKWMPSMSNDSRGTKTTAYFDKLDESSAASVSLVEWLIILEQEIRIKSQKFKWDVYRVNDCKYENHRC